MKFDSGESRARYLRDLFQKSMALVFRRWDGVRKRARSSKDRSERGARAATEGDTLRRRFMDRGKPDFFIDILPGRNAIHASDLFASAHRTFALKGILIIDHLTNNVPKGTMGGLGPIL